MKFIFLFSVVNGAVLSAVAAGNVGEHSDVILEFSMPQNKVDHNYPNRLVAVSATPVNDKKPRRSFPLEKKYVCAVCQKAFDRNTSLTRHMLVHTREKPFKCQLCDKAFSQNAHLKRHILIHIGQKSYQCNKCGKMFVEKGGLARHEATHSTEKPWVCNQCGKAFVLNEYLQRHLFLHTGQKPYQCNECGRLFADGSSWRAHKLTHNKEKKYKCHICQKMLKCKRNFKKHVQAHSEDKDSKHRCEICEERFPNKKLLREHHRRSKKLHRCKTCKRFLKSRDRFMIHAEYHDPNSDKYDPHLKVPGEEFDVDIDQIDDTHSDIEDDLSRSGDEGHKPMSQDHHHQQPLETLSQHHVHSMVVGSHTSSVVVGDVAGRQEDEEILTKILESGKDVVVQQPDQTTGSAVSALTALILKAENNEDNNVTASLQNQTDNNENPQIIQTMANRIDDSELANNMGPSQQVDLSIQLSTGENVQQFTNVPSISQMTTGSHLETLNAATTSMNVNTSHIEVQSTHLGATTQIGVQNTRLPTQPFVHTTHVPPQMSVQSSSNSSVVEAQDGVKDATQSSVNTSQTSMLTNEQHGAQNSSDVAESIILITQNNNDVNMQQM